MRHVQERCRARGAAPSPYQGIGGKVRQGGDLQLKVALAVEAAKVDAEGDELLARDGRGPLHDRVAEGGGGVGEVELRETEVW